MGEYVVNAEFRGHAQPAGGQSRHLRLHHGTAGVDQVEDIEEEAWAELRDAVAAGDRGTFDGVLQGAVSGPPGGWGPEWLDACWGAGRVCWGL